MESRPPLDQLIAGSRPFAGAGRCDGGLSVNRNFCSQLRSSFLSACKTQRLYCLAVVGLLATLVIPIRTWQRLHIIAYLGALLLLICVLIPGVGREVNGATRWIPLGFFTLQGSEFVKVLAAMFIAGYVARPSGVSPSTLLGYLLPIGLTLLLSVLLLRNLTLAR